RSRRSREEQGRRRVDRPDLAPPTGPRRHPGAHPIAVGTQGVAPKGSPPLRRPVRVEEGRGREEEVDRLDFSASDPSSNPGWFFRTYTSWRFPPARVGRTSTTHTQMTKSKSSPRPHGQDPDHTPRPWASTPRPLPDRRPRRDGPQPAGDRRT